jgi:hypothetical protein
MPITHATTTGIIGATQWNEAHDLSLFTPSEIGAVSGAGTAGRVAEFSDSDTIQAANLIAPSANILTLTNAAAATLALNITASKTLTLTAADDYTLTIPASGTAALLGVANVFTAQNQITVATTSTTALKLKTSDNNPANDLLQFLSSSDAILTLFNEKGQLHIGGDVSSYTTYPFTVSSALPGILLKQETAGATNPYIRFQNTVNKDCDIVKENANVVGFLFYGDSIGTFGTISALSGFIASPFTTVNNAVKETLRLSPTVSTAATGGTNGFGAGLSFYAETATNGTNQQQGLISTSWVDATNATRKAKLSLSAYDTAARLGLEIQASGTESMIGFHGVTPIARAVLAAGAGASVDDVITALQNLGLVKQS